VGALAALRAGRIAALGLAGTAAGAASVAAAGPTSSALPLQLVFALRARSAALQRFATAVSTPGDPLYGRFEPVARLAARFGAGPGEIARTVAYLRAHGARAVRVDATGLFVDATLPAGRAERLFATRLEQFRTRRGVYTAPLGAGSIPAALRGTVTAVIGLSTKPIATGGAVDRLSAAGRARAPRAPAFIAGARLSAGPATAPVSPGSPGTPSGNTVHSQQPTSGYLPASGTASGCSGAVATGSFTPAQYLTAYGYGPLRAANITGQGERVALIEIDGFRKSDIDSFASCFGLRVPRVNVFGVGLRHALSPGPEATLDLEVLDSAAPGIHAIDVYESSANESAALRALTAPLQNRGFKPEVISASLGLCEPFVQSAVGVGGLNASNDALAVAAASGISFLASAGDSGSAGCIDERTGEPIPTLAVNFPASSPFATGVGGTNLLLDSADQIVDQVVWNDAGLQPGSAGGGGFSIGFRRPSYQNGTVSSSHRAVPDVSMLADIAPGYAIYCTAAPDCTTGTGAWQGVGGTSAAAPLLAGGFALIDQELRLHKRAAMGLANPLLYEIGRSGYAATVYSTVTHYGNDIGPWIIGRPLGCCTAHAGYNEAAGWGSVNVAGLLSRALVREPGLVRIALKLPRQRPLAAHRVVLEVSCSGRCLIAGAAQFSIGSGKPFGVRSRPYLLARRGRRRITVALRGRTLSRLLAAARGHRPIKGEAFAELVDPSGDIESYRRARLRL
jgi:subtilase family serine protease